MGREEDGRCRAEEVTKQEGARMQARPHCGGPGTPDGSVAQRERHGKRQQLYRPHIPSYKTPAGLPRPLVKSELLRFKTRIDLL